MEHKSTTRAFYEAISANRLDVIYELVAEGFVEHEAMPDAPAGRDGLRQLFQAMHTAFSDFSIQVEDMVGEDDKVFSRVTMQGIQRAEFMGIPSKGKPMAIPVADVFRFEGGRIIEHWGVMDTGMLLHQLAS